MTKAKFQQFLGSKYNRASRKMNYNNIKVTIQKKAAGQLYIVTRCVWPRLAGHMLFNHGEKESTTQLAPTALVCSPVSLSILSGHIRLCLVILRQTTSKQRELTLFTENGLLTMQMTNKSSLASIILSHIPDNSLQFDNVLVR